MFLKVKESHNDNEDTLERDDMCGDFSYDVIHPDKNELSDSPLLLGNNNSTNISGYSSEAEGIKDILPSSSTLNKLNKHHYIINGILLDDFMISDNLND